MLKQVKALPGLALLAIAMAGGAQATELALSGIVGNRAVINVDNGPPQLLAVGKSTPDGVRLLSIKDNAAVVEFEGRRQTLRLGERVVRQTGGDAGKAGVGTLDRDQARRVLARGVEITIESDALGHFLIDGEINGRGVRFLVDTGASLIAIGYSTAQSLGLDLDDGHKSRAHTAGGLVDTWRVTLKSLKIGGLRFDNIDAVVMQADMPQVLLGMNILEQMEMRRDGKLMRLRKKL
ncbi:MAG: retroviral-like aspartic protease family protein [Betaproteobacteria bacterium]|jgi:aspartyl protease family protein|nr:retroviral-like aspartic protease family protein [Betaproteobacteria bacterium]